MSMGDADAKFPNQGGNGLPPSPSRENPGQVFPKSDPKAAPAESVPGTGGEREPTSVMGNPYALKGALSKLDQALSEAISSLEGEESSVGSSANENALVQKFKSWQAELLHLSRGQGGSGGQATGNPQEGPLFTD